MKSVFSRSVLGTILFGLSTGAALACVPQYVGDKSCEGSVNVSGTNKTEIVVKLSGDGLDKLSKMQGVVLPIGQINSGAITAVGSAVRPVAKEITVSALAAGNSISVAGPVGVNTVVVANQLNKGPVTALSSMAITPANAIATDKIEITASAFGNSFSGGPTANAQGQLANFSAAVAQCNTGAITANASYAQVDPTKLTVSATAVGNTASFAAIKP